MDLCQTVAGTHRRDRGRSGASYLYLSGGKRQGVGFGGCIKSSPRSTIHRPESRVAYFAGYPPSESPGHGSIDWNHGGEYVVLWYGVFPSAAPRTMKKIVFLFSLLIFGLIAASTAHAQRAGSAFAAVPVPGQPVSPAPAPTPTPVTPGPAPGIARPTTPGTPGAKPEEQMRIVADMATNSLIIYGSAQEFQNIKNILKELDIVPRQVLMDVLVAEVTLADTQSLGVEYEIF